jgi:hypothetical protein
MLTGSSACLLFPPLCVGFFLRGHPASESDVDDELDDNSDEAEAAYQKLLNGCVEEEQKSEVAPVTPLHDLDPQLAADQPDEPMPQLESALSASKKGTAPMELDSPATTPQLHPPATMAPVSALPSQAPASSRKRPHAENPNTDVKGAARSAESGTASSITAAAAASPSQRKKARVKREQQAVHLRWEASLTRKRSKPTTLTAEQAAEYEKNAAAVWESRKAGKTGSFKSWGHCGAVFVSQTV